MENALKLAREISATQDCDIFLVNADIDIRTYDRILAQVPPSPASTATVILVTNGGDAHDAYRISRFFQTHYKKFEVVVPARCKSAGTLVLLGAHKLFITPFGELGPLDVQTFQPDSLHMSSGATVIEAMGVLNHKAFELFQQWCDYGKNLLYYRRQCSNRCVFSGIRPA